MKMVTTCPACGTSFRIHRDQIDARGGQVRCGHCTVVFDANMYLEVEPEHPPPMPVESVPPREESHIAQTDEIEPTQPLPPVGEAGVDDEPVLLEELGFAPPKPASRADRLIWGTLAAVLAVLLIAQLIFHFRIEIAVAAPELKPMLEEACAIMGCVVPLPARADFISIEADDMQFDSGRPNRLTLTAVLRNRADFDQAFPIIELTLTDEAQSTVSRRLLEPADYLAETLKAKPAFAANSEIAIKLHIQTEGVSASGYRMEVLYP